MLWLKYLSMIEYKEEISTTFFVDNRKRLLPLLEDKSLVLFFSNDQMPRTGDQYFPFRQNANMFYMSGVDLPHAILVLCPQHPNPDLREILFVDQVTQTKNLWDGCNYSRQSLRDISGVKTLYWTCDFERILRDLAYHSHNIYIDVEESMKFASEIKGRRDFYIDRIRSSYPFHRYHRLFPMLADMRLIKSSCEIEQIKKACHITGKAFKRILQFVKPDVWEYEVEAEIVHEFIRNRACAAFSPIVAAGKNGCTLHYVSNNSICKDGDLLLVDFGAEYSNYAGDLSRTIPINGRFTPRQKQVYDACVRVYEYAKNLFIPGMSIAKVYKKVCIVMQQELIDLGLFSQADLEKQTSNYELMKIYFPHNISHFVGLDVHDVGTADIIFEEGMVLSCEPGIYIPNESLGIRIETMMLVSSTPVDLMADIPYYSKNIEDLIATNP
jgi:Xaa-Pro aminopeptidase